jgi:5-formyltetrahydrofolate cyclo-ligase
MRDLGPIDPEDAGQTVTHLLRWMSALLPATASAYLALPDEVDVAGLFDSLPGWRWVLPRLEEDGSMTFRDRDVPREIHAHGMSQPGARGVATPLHEIDLFLVPGLAFDPRGGRLGRGSGHFDRLLARRGSQSLAVGVTTMAHVVDEVPIGPHDQRVDWLATDNGVTECLPRSGPYRR